jgi:hypothetical protein
MKQGLLSKGLYIHDLCAIFHKRVPSWAEEGVIIMNP